MHAVPVQTAAGYQPCPDCCRNGSRLAAPRATSPPTTTSVCANFTALHELVDGRLAALGLVDQDALRRSLDHAAAGMPVAFSEFEPVLAAEVWLRAVEATAGPPQWRPAATTTEGTSP